ncbi:hypothetical protein [Tautonia plasticadhaerens]|nr:hypothetical protein [Tautonia plasticadhaerens]
MGSPGEHPDRVEQLRNLMERLSAPELTLVEAKALRPCLSDLLDSGLPSRDASKATGRSSMAPRPEC